MFIRRPYLQGLSLCHCLLWELYTPAQLVYTWEEVTVCQYQPLDFEFTFMQSSKFYL